jgi:hypothetical protein
MSSHSENEEVNVIQDGNCCKGPLVQRANPIQEQSPNRVISPYPFSHTSQEEMEDREHLSTTGWNMQADDEQQLQPKALFQFDYAQLFESSFIPVEQDCFMEDCDDFSLESSLADDLSLDDPASFWQEGVVVSNNENEPTKRERTNHTAELTKH